MMEIKNNIGRRSFLKLSATAGLAVMANNAFAASPFLKPYVVDNPLKSYPNRDWEKVYRDMFHVDSEFIFLCAPNDTHNCLLKAHVKNDVVIRISPSYGYGDAEDMDGNRSSHRWEPRICNKGMVMNRKAYSDRRPKAQTASRTKSICNAAKNPLSNCPGPRRTRWLLAHWRTSPGPIPVTKVLRC